MTLLQPVALQAPEPAAHVVLTLLQAYILFRAELAAPFTFSAGTESLDVALFDPDSIPFDEVSGTGLP